MCVEYQEKRKKEVSEEYKKEFSERIKNVRKMSEKSGNGLGVISPASYVLKFGDTKIAVDPSLWEIDLPDSVRREYIELLASCDALVITHLDCDHYDESVLDELKGRVTLYIPDFAEYPGYAVGNGDKVQIGECKLTFFEGAHSTPERFMPEYGFSVCFGGKNYVFPADVRDYEKPHPDFGKVEVLVAHLWLGKANALNLSYNPYVDKFADFVNGFSPKRVLLGHMLDFRRSIEDMWSEIHMDAVVGKIPESTILRLGDFVEF